MATQIEYTTTVALNGVTAVTALAAPASGDRRIVARVTIVNTDIADIAPIVQLNENGTVSQKSGSGDSYAVGETFEGGGGTVLDATTDTLEVKLAAAIASANPRAVIDWMEITP